MPLLPDHERDAWCVVDTEGRCYSGLGPFSPDVPLKVTQIEPSIDVVIVPRVTAMRMLGPNDPIPDYWSDNLDIVEDIVRLEPIYVDGVRYMTGYHAPSHTVFMRQSRY